MPTDSSSEVSTLRRMHHLMSRVNAHEDLADVLQTITDGVAEVVGFQVAAISYLHPDGTLEVVAVSGDDDARSQLLGSKMPVTNLWAEFEIAEEWGILRFVPHERLPEGAGQGWVSDVAPLPVPNAWHPMDALFAPLLSPTGELAGHLSVDLPHDGLRPDQFQRELLEMYAVQASIAINNAQQRDRLSEQVRLATSIRTIISTAGRGLDLDHVIDDSVQPIVTGLRARGVWLRALRGAGDHPGRGRVAVYPAALPAVTSDAVLAADRRIAQRCWSARAAVVMTENVDPSPDFVSPAELGVLRPFITAWGSASMLLAPLGAGQECLGYMVLTRGADEPRWTDAEVEAALEIGRELGRAVHHARLFEREQLVVEELQDLDRYKTDLIATISHELKNPLTAILGHLEMLGASPDPSAATQSLRAITRSSARMAAMVDDLLLLSKVGDPHRPLPTTPVDMSAMVRDVAEMLNIHAKQREVSVEVHDEDRAIVAPGDRSELDRAITNLVSNAIKFTPPGGTVRLTLSATGDVVRFECSDNGLGISAADQERLFTEFYRSDNPRAQAVPGTGLGLSIVKRIVERHRGSVSVVSELGVGSTFTLTIPRA